MQAVLLLLKLRKTLGDGTGTLIDSSIEIVCLPCFPVLMHFANPKFTFASMIRRGKKKIIFRRRWCCLVIPRNRSSVL